MSTSVLYPTNPADARYYEPMPAQPMPVQAMPAQPVATHSADQDALSNARYWTGVALTAVIAALVGLIGLVLTRSVLALNLPLAGSDTFSRMAVAYGLGAFGIALVAGALYAAMIRIAPHPTTYFATVLTAVAALAALLPFTTGASLTGQLSLAILNVAVGLIIAIFVPLAASKA